MSGTEKIVISQYEQDATASEGYTVGPLNDEANESLSPAPTITLNRQFEDNPFANRSSRNKFVSNKHDAILKQFSSMHFQLPTSTEPTQMSSENVANMDEEDLQQNDNSSSSDEANEDLDVDDTAPLIFEFPYYLNTTKRNLILMKEHFLQQNRVEALKLAIQTARFLIDDVVLSEPQFYPAIYVLVSKLLDKFGDLVYDRLYSLALYGGDSNVNDQYQHNFIPDMDDNNNNNNEQYTNSYNNPHRYNKLSDSSESDKQIYGMDDDEKNENKHNNEPVHTESLPSNFRASHCSNLCQIKCGNWFFKISAIRELVPRILIEISLYRILRFLYPLSELLSYTKMLIKRLRGISGPLIAAYVSIFALEQIFKTFGTNSFIYDGNEKNEMRKYEKIDFDMIQDIYLQALNDVLFVFKSMYDTNFMFVECVFYGQMASEDYLNLFNPIFETMFDILKYNKVIKNVNDLKIFLNQNIQPELLKLIDLNSFLGIKNCDPYLLKLENHMQNIYNKNMDDGNNKKKRRKKRVKHVPIVAFSENQNNDNHALSEMAQNFQNTDTKKQ